MTMLKIEEYV